MLAGPHIVDDAGHPGVPSSRLSLARAAALVILFAWGPTPTRAARADSLSPPQRGCRVGDPGSSRGPQALTIMQILRSAFVGAAVLWAVALPLAPFAASRPH